jgi:hypothetical protein
MVIIIIILYENEVDIRKKYKLLTLCLVGVWGIKY